MLSPTDIYGEVAYLGVNVDRDATLESAPRERVVATYEGFDGEAHGGLTRPSCSRVLRIHPKRGTEIRNTRQITILGAEELADIGADMSLGEAVRPEWIGANLVLSGVPTLTQVPPSSRLVFDGGAVITVDVENGPCKFPGEVIERHHPGKGKAFPKAARGRRGVVAWIEKTGEIALGERCRLHIPPQRIYAPALTTADAAE